MKYVLRKLTTLIITLFIVSLLAFLAFQVIPGSPATRMLGTNATPEKIAALEAELGFDKPVLVRYGNWMMDFVQGDWGTSYSYSMPVKDMILEKIPATATLVILAFLMVVLFSFPLGIATAKREGSKLAIWCFRPTSLMIKINTFNLKFITVAHRKPPPLVLSSKGGTYQICRFFIDK